VSTRQPSSQDGQPAHSEWHVLGRVTEALAAEPALDRVAQVIADEARRVLQAGRVVLWRLDPEHAELRLIGSSGVSTQTLVDIGTIPLTAPTAATQAARTGEACEVPDVQAAGVELSMTRRLAQRGGECSTFAQPLIAASRLVGVLALSSPTPRRLGPDERALVRALADLSAVAIERAESREQATALRDLRASNQRLVLHNAHVERKADEAEQGRTQLADILNRITDGFCALDREWRFTYLNDEAERLFREAFPNRPDKLLGEVLWEALPEAVGTVFEQELRRAMTEQVTVTFAMWFPSAGAWLEDHVYPTPDGLSVYCRDITERKRMEDALRQSEASLARAQQIARLGNWERDVETGRLRWSDEIYRIFGTTPQAFEGTFAAFLSYVHPDDRKRVQAALGEALNGSRSYSIDHRIVRPDGSERIVHEAAEVVRDAVGQPMRLVGTVHDITERKRAEDEREEALRRLEDERTWLREVIERSPAGIVLVQGCHAERVVPNHGVEELFGQALSVEGMTAAKYLWQLSQPDGTPVSYEELAGNRALRGEIIRDQELLVRQPSGRVLNVLVSASPIRNATGAIIGAVVVYQDVTRIRELERQREEWTWTVSHDLRQPATIIMGYASWLAKRLRDLDLIEDRTAAEHVLTAARTLNTMIDDLLDVSRIEAHRVAIERQPVDLPVLVRAHVDRMATTMRGHPVWVDVHGEISETEVDPRRIEQVMGNLLSNAAKYSAPETEIIVTVAQRDAEITVSVTNSGVGIVPEDMPRLFTRFYRTPRTQAGRVSGLGLGLYIAKGLVEAHGGHIWAESIPDQTTTFRFTLPIRPAEG
jgi:PAS domain S-box-containing protein